MVFTDPAEQESWARASLVVQWLRLCAPNAGGPGSTPDLGTRSHMLQLRIRIPQLRILHVSMKTWCSQINIKNIKSSQEVKQDMNCWV